VDRADIELIRFGGWIMRRRIGIVGSIAALAAVGMIGWSALAVAQDRTVNTGVKGTVSGAGTWGRTIIDGGEPNGPNGGAIQATFVVNVPFTNGMTAQQLADAYKAAAAGVLPAPANNPNGYGTVSDNRVDPTIRVGRQTGTFTYNDAGLPGGVTLDTYAPFNSEHAPLASPAGLAAMAASLSGLAWWARRRRVSA
jgi:hypothetical protein